MYESTEVYLGKIGSGNLSMSNLIIIPARGGSKGYREKHRVLNGKPLIQYSIECAINSFQKVIRTQLYAPDDPKILEFVGSNYNSIELIKRPDDLATDKARLIDVLCHTYKVARDSVGEDSNCITLQPTCPIRSPNDIKKCLDTMVMSRKESLAAVCEAINDPTDLIYNIDGKISMVGNYEDLKIGFRQGFKRKSMFITGSVYIHKPKWLYSRETLWTNEESTFCELPMYTGIDIDNLFDFELAEGCLKTRSTEIYWNHSTLKKEIKQFKTRSNA